MDFLTTRKKHRNKKGVFALKFDPHLIIIDLKAPQLNRINLIYDP
jgi:NAD-specific glutamate dehydrogenase